jgi:hypothetical protein
MISKKPLTKSQRITLRTIDFVENNLSYFGWAIFLLASGLAAHAVHTGTNNYIKSNCNLSLYQIVETPTAFGPAYSCVSRVQKQGPAPTFKD